MAWVYREGVQQSLTEAERNNNAQEFYNIFSAYGCTLESICGMLGNIQQESDINPANKQSLDTQSGWGLIQWTPSTDLTNWITTYGYSDWKDGDAQCDLIKAEGEGTMGAGGRWLPTTAYPYSWSEFCQLTDVTKATKAYLYERERAGTPHVLKRVNYAKDWYEFFTGTPIYRGRPLPLIYMAHRVY